jgi:hypothetical protein
MMAKGLLISCAAAFARSATERSAAASRASDSTRLS